MKFTIFATIAASVLAVPLSGRADVGVYEPEPPAVERRIYTERVEPVPTYREEVRVYRTVPTYVTRVYREDPVIIREAPFYPERRVLIVPPAPHRVVRRVFGHW